MQKPSLPTPLTRLIGWRAAAAVVAGAAMGAITGQGRVPPGRRAAWPLRLRPRAALRPARWSARCWRWGRWLAEGLLRRRGWARWAAVVAFSLLGITSLAGLVDWTGALMRSRADGRWPIPAERVAVDLATPVLFLAISIGVIVLLMTPATRRDFRSSHQLPAGANGSGPRQA
jgi:hypothetical protein